MHVQHACGSGDQATEARDLSHAMFKSAAAHHERCFHK